MPYESTSDLPKGVRDNLPDHAQEIYVAAFNNAWEEYGKDEERAHRVAWSAVKETYEKDDVSGRWVRKGL
jgi:cation transport regulator